MKMNPFDQQIKQTLEQSPLPLPEHSWARLNKQLNQAEAQSARRRLTYRWVWLAASVFVLMGLGYSGLWNTLVSNTEPTAIPAHNQEIATATPTPKAAAPTDPHHQPAQVVAPPTPQHLPSKPASDSPVGSAQQLVMATPPTRKTSQDPTLPPTAEPATAIAQAPSAPAVSATVHSSNNAYLQLLDGVKAQPQSVQVAPQQLYESVNTERQREYRENVFGRVYKKVQSVRDAVAQRNQQE